MQQLWQPNMSDGAFLDLEVLWRLLEVYHYVKNYKEYQFVKNHPPPNDYLSVEVFFLTLF